MTAALPPALPLRLTLFGPLGVDRDGQPLAVPASRKTRAILGFLALSARAVSRQRLCDLFFDQPDDPRASLRWSLTKLRPLVDAPDAPRLVTERDTLRFEPRDMDVDARTVQAIAARPVETLSLSACDEALALMSGALLEDCELPERPEYAAWLAAQRQDFQALALHLARVAVDKSAGAERIVRLHRLVSLDPLDEAAVGNLARALMEAGRKEEAHAAIASAERAIAQAGLKPGATLRAALRGASAVGTASRDHSGLEDAATAPVVAVLPFRDLSAAPLPKHVAAGLFDGVTHALSRFRSIIVVSADSARRYADRLEDPKPIAEALGADILVGGSVMAAPDGRLRLRWRAVEGETGRLIMSGDVEGHLDDVWTLQEDAARRVAVEVEPLAQAEALRAQATRPTASAQAYDLYLQGLYAGFSPHGRDYLGALDLLEHAMRLDPTFLPALALGPWAAAYGNAIKGPEDLARYAQMSRDALRLGRDDARTQATAGTALFYMAHDFDIARVAIERALALNPNEYTAWICGGWMHAMKGEAERAHAMFDRAERLNPLAYGANGLMSGRAMADFMVGRIQDSERFIRMALSGDDSHPSALMTGIATAHLLGGGAALAERGQRFLNIYPEGIKALAIQSLPFEDPACRARYFDTVAEGLAALR
mgnify:FL=1